MVLATHILMEMTNRVRKTLNLGRCVLPTEVDLSSALWNLCWVGDVCCPFLGVRERGVVDGGSNGVRARNLGCSPGGKAPCGQRDLNPAQKTPKFSPTPPPSTVS